MKIMISEFDRVFKIAKWRFFLLRRQKLIFGSMLFGLLAMFFCFAVASSSYLLPKKVYWDFVLGFCFVAITFLSVYTASSLLGDERQRRTIHLLLASGVSRRSWLWGNYIGIIAAKVVLLMIWMIFASLFSMLLPAMEMESGFSLALIAQAQFALVLELLIVVAMSLSFSFFLRPALAMILSLVLVLFLHSQLSLLTVLGDGQTGAFNSPLLLPTLQWIVPLLPPLEWYDLRVLVGYEAVFSWSKLCVLWAMAIAWAIFWIEAGLLKFRKTDL
jgi:ABC-type transport system involved in multi-copper enzyme maturation permease subunit